MGGQYRHATQDIWLSRLVGGNGDGAQCDKSAPLFGVWQCLESCLSGLARVVAYSVILFSFAYSWSLFQFHVGWDRLFSVPVLGLALALALVPGGVW